MKKQETHKKSLEFLDKFIANKADVLKKIIDKHKNTIAGPTYNEYIESLGEDYMPIDYILCQPDIPEVGFDEQSIESNQVSYYWPPTTIGKNKKKDSAKSQSLFFFSIIAL